MADLQKSKMTGQNSPKLGVKLIGFIVLFLTACAGQDSFKAVNIERNFELKESYKKTLTENNHGIASREIIQVERKNSQNRDRLGLIRGSLEVSDLWVQKSYQNLTITFNLNIEHQNVGKVKIAGVLNDESTAFLAAEDGYKFGEVGAKIICLSEWDSKTNTEISKEDDCKQFYFDIYIKQKNRILTDQFVSRSNLIDPKNSEDNSNKNQNGSTTDKDLNKDEDQKKEKSKTNASDNNKKEKSSGAPAAANLFNSEGQLTIMDDAPTISSGGFKTNHESNIQKLFGSSYTEVRPEKRFFELDSVKKILNKNSKPNDSKTNPAKGDSSSPSNSTVNTKKPSENLNTANLPGMDVLSLLTESRNQAIGKTNLGRLNNPTNIENLLKSGRIKFNNALETKSQGKSLFGTFDVALLIAKMSNWVVEERIRNQLFIGDISVKTGGLVLNQSGVSRHRSHQNGLDVDVYLLANNPAEDGKDMVIKQNGKKVITNNFLVKENFLLTMKAAEENDLTFIMVDPVVRQQFCMFAKSNGLITSKTDTGAASQMFKRLHVDNSGLHNDHIHYRVSCHTDNRHRGCTQADEYAPQGNCF